MAVGSNDTWDLSSYRLPPHSLQSEEEASGSSDAARRFLVLYGGTAKQGEHGCLLKHPSNSLLACWLGLGLHSCSALVPASPPCCVSSRPSPDPSPQASSASASTCVAWRRPARRRRRRAGSGRRPWLPPLREMVSCVRRGSGGRADDDGMASALADGFTFSCSTAHPGCTSAPLPPLCPQPAPCPTAKSLWAGCTSSRPAALCLRRWTPRRAARMP